MTPAIRSKSASCANNSAHEAGIPDNLKEIPGVPFTRVAYLPAIVWIRAGSRAACSVGAQNVLIRAGILLVDSNPFFRRTLRGILYNQGARQLIDAESVAAARRSCLGLMPRLIFLDWGPDNDSAEALLSEIRSGDLGCEAITPVIAMTARPERSLLMRMKASGASGCILKPFSEKVISRHLEWVTRALSPLVDEDIQLAGQVGS